MESGIKTEISNLSINILGMAAAAAVTAVCVEYTAVGARINISKEVVFSCGITQKVMRQSLLAAMPLDRMPSKTCISLVLFLYFVLLLQCKIQNDMVKWGLGMQHGLNGHGCWYNREGWRVSIRSS